MAHQHRFTDNCARTKGAGSSMNCAIDFTPACSSLAADAPPTRADINRPAMQIIKPSHIEKHLVYLMGSDIAVASANARKRRTSSRRLLAERLDDSFSSVRIAAAPASASKCWPSVVSFTA